MPVEIVAPEREKPRNGMQSPCTTPMMPDWPSVSGFGGTIAAFNGFGRTPADEAAALGQAGDQDEDSRAEERGGDEIEAAEQLFDFSRRWMPAHPRAPSSFR